ncbi:hypothetical protein [Pseudobacteroides cellulosolvens]|uniref:Uncharacterized protein n=1 Tax=Pseudobacteroides cellulosolvens ATCC 35603 = DSM 2933 TaxID=398512 RepID=A0A0L6JWI7_9FIRM|nr:hypothetical protein [Pseudobacteroides cellulosolvens]KNY30198.1 hypothetical protein Bccel_5475 [Pseudobacteroides cellulosolvens ATCC 35603 = DSM 2933]
MTYTTYSNGYNIMYKIDGKYYYSGALSYPRDERLNILQDSSTGKFFIRRHDPLIKEIVNVGIGSYSYRPFGYSESGGKIITNNLVPFIGQQEYFPEYFRRLKRWVVKYDDDSLYVFNPVNIDGKDYINISDIGAAFGFSFSMEKDDIKRIQLINVA